VKLTKEQGFNVSLSAIVSLIVVGSSVWVVARPAITSAVAGELKEEMREEIQSTVQTEVAPIKGAQVILLEQQVVQTQKQIAQLERIRAADPSTWSAQQANELVDARAQLEAQQRALSALRQ
jgi:hypothetical protein